MVDAQIRHRDHFVTVMEAEDGTLNGGMTRARDSSASGGAFVHALDESGTVTFGFDVPADGPYYVLGRCLAPAPSGSHDSFIYAMDLSPPFVWDVHAYSKGWCWDVLNQRNDENQRRSVDPWLFRLSQGHHTLTITARELGCRLDRIAISNSPYAP